MAQVWQDWAWWVHLCSYGVLELSLCSGDVDIIECKWARLCCINKMGLKANVIRVFLRDHEDHRWESVRAKLQYPEKKLPFHIYNFVLMAFIQNWILIGHALPMWFVQTNRSGGRLTAQAPLNAFDIVLVLLFLVFFMFEYLGDEQQWKFQENKKKWYCFKSSHWACCIIVKWLIYFFRLADTKEGGDLSRYTAEEVEDYTRGFLVKGLFAYCRHPNYFGELFMWWTIWAFTLSSQYTAFQQSFHVGDLFNYACYSSIIMTLLFPRSSKITEKICMSKYAEYKSYIAKTNMIFPSLSRYVPEKQDWLLTNSNANWDASFFFRLVSNLFCFVFCLVFLRGI